MAPAPCGYTDSTTSRSPCSSISTTCYVTTPESRTRYIEYIDEQYSSERMTEILCKVASMIGATVLEASRQDYDPQAMLLMAWFAWTEWVRRA